MFVPSGSCNIAVRAPQDWSAGCAWNWIPRSTSSVCVLSTLSTKKLTWSMPAGFKLNSKAWRATGSFYTGQTKLGTTAKVSNRSGNATQRRKSRPRAEKQNGY